MSYLINKEDDIIYVYGGKIHMYELLSLLTGVILALMIKVNGLLSNSIGVYTSTLVVHIVGSIFAYLVLLAQHKKIKIDRSLPFYLYLGGVIGVSTTLFSTIAVSKISMVSIIALEQLAKLITSFFIDKFYLDKSNAHHFSFIGIIISIVGILLMLGSLEIDQLIYISLPILAGVAVIVSRTLNGSLSNSVGNLECSFINHFTGMIVCVFLFIFSQEHAETFLINPIYYLGGIMGVATVLLNNITVNKLSASSITLISLCGQMFTGILLDILFNGSLNKQEFLAAILITLGIIIDKLSKSKALKTNSI